MTWTAQSGNTYNLCLLDTNALSEIIKRPNVEGRGFVERFSPNSFAPCFTAYNLIELRRKKSVFKGFVEFFSMYPCFLLKPHQMILNDEKKFNQSQSTVSPLMNAFSQLGSDSSYEITKFVEKLFSGLEMNRLEQNWRNEESTTLKAWLSNKSNFSPKRSVPNAVDADRYVKEAGLQSLIASDPHWAQTQINDGRVPNIDEFPSLKVMLYSQYYRLYDPNWIPKPQEVTDVMIISAAPYMDVVITEAFQAEILKKAKNKVKGLEKVELVTLKGIRYKG